MSLLKNTDSIKAINQYILYVKSKGGNITRHKASVLIKGEGYPVSTYVGIIEVVVILLSSKVYETNSQLTL